MASEQIFCNRLCPLPRLGLYRHCTSDFHSDKKLAYTYLMADDEVIETPELSSEATQPSSDVLTKTEGSIERSESQNSTTGPTPETPPEIPEEVLPQKPVEIPAEIQPEPSTEGAQPRSSSSELTTGAVQPSSDVLTQTEGSIEQSESQNSTTEPIPEQPSVPLDISQLTDDQLKAAAALWAKKNQAEFSKKGVAKRKQTMELNLRTIVDYLSHNNGAPLPRIARHTNITAGTTSKYLRQLIAAGKVRAEGWAKDRRYYLK